MKSFQVFLYLLKKSVGNSVSRVPETSVQFFIVDSVVCWGGLTAAASVPYLGER